MHRGPLPVQVARLNQRGEIQPDQGTDNADKG